MSMTTRRRGEQQSATSKIGTDRTSESHGETEPAGRRRSASMARTPLAESEGAMELRRRSSSSTPVNSKSDKLSTPSKSTTDTRSTRTPTGKLAERSNTPASSPARRSERQNSTGSTGDKSTSSSSKTPSSDGKGFEKIIKTRAAAQVMKSGTEAKQDASLKPPPLKYEGPGSRKRLLVSSPEGRSSEGHPPSKRKRTIRKTASGQDTENDFFCWMCHKEGNVICCELCPRVYHTRCLGVDKGPPGDWVCPECQKIMQAECTDTRSKAMAMLSSDQLCMLLKFALQRMKNQGVSKSEPFHKPVDIHDEPNYTDYIFNPMDMMTLEKNIKKKMYGSTEAFLADTKWILHNCIIYNGIHHKLTTCAKAIIKICRHEMSEIEICPDCYTNSCLKKKDNWFCEPCSTPHPLVWAKLKGYPFWPAKALRVMNNQVDVRFFGAHDRAWVPMSQVYLLSKEPPVPMKNKKSGYEESMEELELHISRIRDKFSSFNFSPFRTPYDSAHPYNAFKLNKTKSPKSSPVKKLKLSSPAGSPTKSPAPHSSSSTGATSPVSPRKTGARLQSLKRSGSGIEEKVISIVSKTASAVKSKYNSFSTRRAERALLQSVSDQSDEEKGKSVKTTEDSIAGEEPEESPDSGTLNRKESNEVLHTETISGLSEEKNSDENTQDEKLDETKSISVTLSDSADASEGKKCVTDERDSKSELENQEPAKTSETQVTDSNEVKIDETDSGVTTPAAESGSENSNIQVEGQLDKIEPLKIRTESSESQSRNIPGKDSQADLNFEIQGENEQSQMETDVSLPSGSDATEPSGSQSDLLPKGDKKNPFLENLVESCKAKLGITNEEDLPTGEDSAIEEEEEEEESGAAEDSGKPTSSQTAIISEKTTDSVPVKTAADLVMEKTTDSVEKEVKDGVEEVVSANNKEGSHDEENQQIKPTGEPEETEGSKVAECKPQDDCDEKSVAERAPVIIVESKQKDDSQKSDLLDNGPDKSVSTTEAETRSITSDETVASKLEAITHKPEEKSHCTSKDIEDPMDTAEKESDQLPAVKEKISESPKDLTITDSHMGKRKRDQVETDSLSDSDESSQLVIDLSQEESDIVKSLTQQAKAKLGPKSASMPHGVAIRAKEQAWRERQWQRKVKQHKSQKPSESNEESGSRVNTATPTLPTVLPSSPATAPASAPTASRSPTIQLDSEVAAQPSAGPSTSAATSQPNAALPLTSLSSSLAPSLSNLLPGFDLNKYTSRVMDSVKASLEDLYNDIMSSEANGLIMKSVTQEMQKLQWRHFQELKEMRHNIDLTINEMRTTMEEEKKAAVAAAKQQMESDKNKAIEETKKKQWCANCSKEAMFYCCWNTSYCDYPCQQAHWPQHMNVCTQTQTPQTTEQPTILPESINTADIPLADQAWKNNARDSLSAVLKRQEQERQQHQQQQQRAPSQFGPSVSSSSSVYIHPQMLHSQNMQNPVVQYVPQSMSQPMMRQPGMNYQTPQQQMGMQGQPVMQQRPMMQPGGAGGPVMYLRPQQPLMLSRQPSPSQQSVGMMRPTPPQQPVGMMRGSPMYQPGPF